MFFADALNPGNRQEALDERIGIALAQGISIEYAY
jgi:hypothetical protein